MEIFAKSRFDSNIYDKVRKGAKAIELHLDEEFLLDTHIWNEKIINDVQIRAVHMPLVKHSDLYIEEVSARQIVVWVCEFAHRISIAQGHNVMVVAHLGMSPWQMQRVGIFQDLIKFIRDLVNTYSGVELVIENVTRFNTCIENCLMFDHVDFHSAPDFVKAIDHPNVGTCLDTCHAMIDIRVLDNLQTYFGHTFNNEELTIGMEAFFRANAQTIKLIHLSNAKTHGMWGDHGMPFQSKEDTNLRKIIDLYYKYNYNCPITLEVTEDDYSNAVNFATTQKALLETIG